MAERRRVPIWLRAFWGASAVVFAYASWVEIGGDPAVSNLVQLGAAVLAGIVTVVWFGLAGPAPRRLRLAVLFVVAAGLALFLTFFRLDSVSGSLRPVLTARGADALRGPLPEPSGRRADLRSTTGHDFPGFLGRNRDLRVERVRLARDWQSRPPVRLWRQAIGAGWSGFAVVNGFAATLEQWRDQEMVTLYAVETGELVWRYEVQPAVRFDGLAAGAGPRSTPSIDDGMVYAVTVYGQLLALDGATGELVWRYDLAREHGSTRELESVELPYGRPSSPLVHHDLVIVPVGGSEEHGRVSVAAFDQADGGLRWTGGSHQISMASPGIGVLAGVEQVLVVNEDWVSGHHLGDGRELWRIPWPGKSASDANVSQAVAISPNRVFLSKGYGVGAALFELEPAAGGGFGPREVWRSSRVLRTKFTNVVVDDGWIYGLSEGVLECVELLTGERAWKAGRYGHGQILLAGDVLLVLSEQGELVMVEATPERPDSVLGRFQAIEGQTWNNFALYRDVVLVRNAREAAAYRLPLAQAG